MCGIAGVLRNHEAPPINTAVLDNMLSLIHHRGPDERGLYRDRLVGMGSTRLSIIDIQGGQQPISNEDGTIWIVFNGEIYNYVELANELRAKGHTIRTNCDTEVIVHLYEEYGVECLHKLNGQFAFAIWDVRKTRLFLARDRVGIRPLFYTRTRHSLVFGSEIKSILAHPDVSTSLDPIAIDQTFTFWTTLSPRTVFRGIYELPPGHFLVANGEHYKTKAYWHLSFPPEDAVSERSLDSAIEELNALLADSVRLRLRADVPVAAYLSGGIDSSTTTDFIRRFTNNDLHTFSIGFHDPEFDETRYQTQAAAFFRTHHTNTVCSAKNILDEFANVIWHTETPILRTAPVPMYLLSRLVHEHGIKVVVTGEGADELLAGYNIFKEMLVRRFWARQPESQIRPLLLKRLYPYLPHISRSRAGMLRAFFEHDLTNTSDPLYSHTLRWHNTSRIKQFFSPAFRASLEGYQAVDELRASLNANFKQLSPLSQAQYLETRLFMSGYLLSSQGDRVSMAHSVEGRYPFLDHRLIEWCANLPAHFKLRGLNEKYVLKQMMKSHLPDDIINRSKQPYRAPGFAALLTKEMPDVLLDALSEAKLNDVGLFNPPAVNRLLSKARLGKHLSETEEMALVGIVSTQVVHQTFIEAFNCQSQTLTPCVTRVCSTASV